MSENLYLAVVWCLLGLTSAQVFSQGACPKVQLMKSFDLQRYLGDWYEVYKFYSAFEVGQHCARANYTLKDNGHIRILNRGYKDGHAVNATGDAYIPHADRDPAKLALRFSSFAPYGNYWVVETDYDNYTFVYSCSSVFGVTHYEFAWILSRHKNIDDATKRKLFALAESYGIKTASFRFQDQSGCPDI